MTKSLDSREKEELVIEKIAPEVIEMKEEMARDKLIKEEEEVIEIEETIKTEEMVKEEEIIIESLATTERTDLEITETTTTTEIIMKILTETVNQEPVNQEPEVETTEEITIDFLRKAFSIIF